MTLPALTREVHPRRPAKLVPNLRSAGRQIAPPAIALVVALAILVALTRVMEIPEYILPELTSILSAYPDNAALILQDSLTTVSEIVVGLAVGTTIGVLGAIIIASSSVLERAFMPWMAFLQNVPTIVLGPVIIVWLGFGLAPKVLIVVIVVFFPILVTTASGIRDSDPDLVDLVRGLGGSRREIYTRVRLPSAVPAFFSGLRLAATVAPIGAIVGEWLGAEQGLGYRILVAQGAFQLELLFALVVVLALIGTVLYQGVVGLDHLVTRRYRVTSADVIDTSR